MNEEKNVVSQQNSSAPTEVGMIEEKKVKTRVKILLIILWVIYLPIALFIFSISGMAGDSPYTPAWQVWAGMLLINGIPLIVMATLTYFAIKKNGIFGKIFSNAIFAWFIIIMIVWSVVQWIAGWFLNRV